MFEDGITEMTHGHLPAVTDEPIDLDWTHQLHQRHLEGLSQRLHNVGTNVIHGPLFDKGIEEPQCDTGKLQRPKVQRIFYSKRECKNCEIM